ncbi:MAG TPA: DNA polymerase ligase N-terminal domain-containing protein [Actinomycetota bacterium]|nr:DNA polymerase ligase N-terminal domain-containing protein [Actinomycetota bacterium]
MAPGKDYQTKRDFNESPEPEALVTGDVNPHRAEIGETFVIHQHHATRLHFDLRLEMLNGRTPVLVSWAVPKNLPLERGKRHLAIHVEDHPFDYGSFSGKIPAGNYGAGEVRIFDSGKLEILERDGKKLTFRLLGRRIQGVFHLIQTSAEDDKWLVLLDADERPPREPLPRMDPMIPIDAHELPTGTDWSYEPLWPGKRILVRADSETHLIGEGIDGSDAGLATIHRQIVATDAFLDGLLVGPGFVAVDLLYMDGRSLVDSPFQERRRLLEDAIVSSSTIQVGLIERDSGALLKAVMSQGFTGVVAKSLSSKYLSGVSSQSWVRIRIS